MMDSPDSPAESLPVEPLQEVFYLQETRREGDRVFFYGESLVPQQTLLEEVWPAFHDEGYRLQFSSAPGYEDVLVAEPQTQQIDGVPWTNLLLLTATVLTTLFVGALTWYYIPLSEITRNPFAVLRAWPFSAAILGVLLTHELGHYVMGRYHGVDVSLPYLIPFVFPFGTMGAIIRMRGQMPDREALFDIGVAGPLAGLAATVVVTVIGLSLPPMTIPSWVQSAGGDVIIFHNPPLLTFIADALGQPTDYASQTKTVHPVVIGGWVGMFFTVLNLLPVGQLDGGHMLRAMVGKRQETIAALVPLTLFGLAGYLHYVRDLGLSDSVGLWAIWGLFSTFIAYNGPATPIDETPIGWKRFAVGVLTFALGALCFLVVPIELLGS
jgi:membrane-associated protease RseP (regulator of RpoE activity)